MTNNENAQESSVDVTKSMSSVNRSGSNVTTPKALDATSNRPSKFEEYQDDVVENLANDAEVESFPKKLQRLQEMMTLQRKLSKSKKKMPVDSSLQEDIDQLVEELKYEIETETTKSQEKMKIEKKNMVSRKIQLKHTLKLLRKRSKIYNDYILNCWEDEKWCCYRLCKNLPDPSNVQDFNSYLYIESFEDSKITVNVLPEHLSMRICVINFIDEAIEFPLENKSIGLEHYKEVRQKYRDTLPYWIDRASYNLLRNIEKNTSKVDLKNARYINKSSPLVCCFWAFIKLPICMKQVNERERIEKAYSFAWKSQYLFTIKTKYPKAVSVEFEEIHLSITLPQDVDSYCTAIRVNWLSYDYYSDLSATFYMPEVPEKNLIQTDILSFCIVEYTELSIMREEQFETREQRLKEKKEMINRILNPESKKGRDKRKKGKIRSDSMSTLQMAPEANMANPDEIILQREEYLRKETRRLLFTRCKKSEINLRKYVILGGHYQIDLIRQPPQPKEFRKDITLTTFLLPKDIEFIEFYRPYKAPALALESERTPEVIEAEMKELEASMEALVLVTIRLPETELWFEPPLVAHWLPEERIWSTDAIHDIKYNEEKQTISFRTGRLGIHGLAAYRFANLPFQSWELRPEPEKNGNGVIISITGAIIQLEFLVRDAMVCLHAVVGASKNVFENIEGVFMQPHKLFNILRRTGCDFFPKQDATSYVKGIALKHPVAVRHLQECMGLLCAVYSFSWSRWNATRGFRDIVFQMKELHSCTTKDKSNAIMLVTPFQASVLNCSEVSTEFSAELANENDQFYADVYQYALRNAAIKSQLMIKTTSLTLANTVSKILDATSVIGMSS